MVSLPDARAIEFSADSGRLLVSGGEGLVAWIVDARTGRLLARTAPHAGPVECARFSRDGGRLATASQTGQIGVWNGTNAAPLTPWIRLGGAVCSLDFRPDGQWLAVGSLEGVVRLFDTRTAEIVGLPLAVEPGRVSVQFSPDGEWLLTAGVEAVDGRVTLWHAASGVAVSEPIRYRGLQAARFCRDGTRLLIANTRRFSAGSIINQAHVHFYGPAALPPNDFLLTMAELVTSTRLDPGQPRRELTDAEFRTRQEILKARYGIPAPTPHLVTLR